MILRDRYGPRLRDEGGCRSRKRLSRLHVTLPGCWVRVGRRAYGDGCCALFVLLLTVHIVVKNNMAVGLHGSSGLAIEARVNTIFAVVERGLANRLRSK